MRATRWLSVVALASAVTVAGGAQQWYAHFRMPPARPLPVPQDLVPLDSPAGQRLLAQSTFLADYKSLAGNFESQSRPAFCGVASSVIVLNALHATPGRLTQSTFFAPAQIRRSLEVTYRGMGLADLAALLRSHGTYATAYYASDLSLEDFRAMAKQNLSTPGDFMLVNYERAVLGEEAMPHISPVAAYNAATDQLLVLDVAAYKYPPVWVPTRTLWRAMKTVADRKSGRTRGAVVVRGRLAEAEKAP